MMECWQLYVRCLFGFDVFIYVHMSIEDVHPCVYLMNFLVEYIFYML